MSRNLETFATVRVEGAILPTDLLQRIAVGDARLGGLRPEDYRLAGEKVNEATNLAWNRLLPAWEAFKASAEKLPPADPGHAVTLNKWLLPLWRTLEYGQLDPAMPFEIDGKIYAISHARYQSPIHLVSYRQDLDKRIETPEGKKSSPHGLVQEFLNRSEAHLWGFVCNGLKLRILRDNVRLTRQAFVEFDLQAMFDGKVYSDFALLWRLCHESRVHAEKPEQCWLEKWSKAAAEQGLRALDQLRGGVENAVEALGRGFLHPANTILVQKLRSGTLPAMAYYRQVLRVVYRLLFLFVAEDRELLFDPAAPEPARERYGRFYSAARLRRLAERLRGTQHTDLYQGLDFVLTRLGTTGSPELGLPALGGLFDPAGTHDLAGCRISNADLLEAVRDLAVVSDGRSLRPVDYRNLGSEELGSVYESLLELHPQFTPDPPAFALKSASGHERKTTGSYYTPTSLITCLLDSALDPVLDEAAAKTNAEKAILDLKVCDPACGSGHFLIAAAHRIAKRLAAVRTLEEEPAPDAIRRALRDVIGRCVFGVDINPMAVELCQVALWMESLEPGKPLSFLKHHIQCGNSLLGTTPALLAKGIPEAAFEPIEGDDKELCRFYKRQNKEERQGRGDLHADIRPWERLGDVAAAVVGLDAMPDDTVEQVRTKEQQYERLVAEGSYRTSGQFLADLWCAAFVWKKTRDFDYPITERSFRLVENSPHDITPWMYNEVRRLAGQYQFLHWHLAFPGVFRPPSKGESPGSEFTGWSGGFDVILGNPPWEQLQLDPREFFAKRAPEIAAAQHMAARNAALAELELANPRLHQEYREFNRYNEGLQHFIHQSGGFPLSSRGRLNSAPLFVETARHLIHGLGRLGLIVPAGIATDSFTQHLFHDLIKTRTLTKLFGFENEAHVFQAVHNATKFCLLICTGLTHAGNETEFVFHARQTSDLTDPDRHFSLSAADFLLLAPNTGTCPVFRHKGDAALNKHIYKRVPVLVNEAMGEPGNLWGFRGLLMFMMNTGSVIFRTREQLERDDWKLDGSVFLRNDRAYLPLYEAKMVHHFDHRYGTYEGQTRAQANKGFLPYLDEAQHADPYLTTLPRYWVPADEVTDRIKEKWSKRWLLGWRDICRNTDTRTVIPSLIPLAGVGHKFPVLLTSVGPRETACLYALLCSFALDYFARQKLGSASLTFSYIKQFPVLRPSTFNQVAPWDSQQSILQWLTPRILELTFTSWDLQAFAHDCGDYGPPYRWNNARRFLLRCELDAVFFYLYLGSECEWREKGSAELLNTFATPRAAIEYIMGTFSVVRRKDELAHEGRFITCERIRGIYDALADAADSGGQYRTLLDPPPADARCRHAARDDSRAPGAVWTSTPKE